MDISNSPDLSNGQNLRFHLTDQYFCSIKIVLFVKKFPVILPSSPSSHPLPPPSPSCHRRLLHLLRHRRRIAVSEVGARPPPPRAVAERSRLRRATVKAGAAFISDEVVAPTTTPQAAQRADGPDPGIGSHAAAPADGDGEEEEEAPSPRPSSAGCYTFLRSASRRGGHWRLDSSASASAAAHVGGGGDDEGREELVPPSTWPCSRPGRCGASSRRPGGGPAVAVAVDALLFEHLWWLQPTPTSSLPSPSWVIDSPNSRPLAPPDSVDVIALPSSADAPPPRRRRPPTQQIHAARRPSATTVAALPCSRSTPPAAALDHNVIWRWRSLVCYEFILKSATLDDSPGCGFFANTRVNLANDMRNSDYTLMRLLAQADAINFIFFTKMDIGGLLCCLQLCRVGLDSMRVSRACAFVDHGCGWDVGSGRCSGCGDDCFFLGWEPPFADLAAADARISFHVCVPEDLWDASSSRNSDRARPIPATFSVMYGKVGISADTHPQFYLRLFLQR
uniref:Uncharacterized protein n=1 Tax=Oryza nivara TaxID=4536 RepID=A0A0E0G154_ORYNI